ncbi:penicillin-binding protein 2 [Verrucomicrobia bacterium]|nr:penicillin-binding protein 2 [Verrucomicrobiota bacterium]
MEGKNNIQISKGARRWLFFFAFVMLLSFGALGYRLIDLQVRRHHELQSFARDNTIRTIIREPRRGDISDIRGNLLATSLFVKTICADPVLIGQWHPHVAQALAPILDLDEMDLSQRLKPKMILNEQGILRTNRYIVIKRKVPRELWDKAAGALRDMELGMDESKFNRKQRLAFRSLRRQSVFVDRKEDQLRVYPSKNHAAHILGFVGGVDHRGKEGVEHVLDSKLVGSRGWLVTETDSRKREVVALRQQDVAPRNGLHVVLTIDSGVQHIVEAELANALTKHQPLGITAIVVRPRTGAIVAMANLPDFDPNVPGVAKPETRRNRAVTDTAEPGSTFKIVPVAAALNERTVSLASTFHCENGSFQYAGRVLRDHHAYSHLTVKAIITKSSNIGAAKVGLRLGAPSLHAYIQRFGFGARSRISLPGEVRGTVHPLKKWNKLSLTRVTMGHEVTATPLQMAMMMSAIANGGKLMRPMVIDHLKNDRGQVVVQYHPEPVRQVVSPEAARATTEALKTVTAPGGTAKRAALQYYTVAGKTGTAQKAGRGGYLPGKYYASFVGFFPANAPALCILVSMDEPKGDYYGGLTAAPVFKAIAERTAAYLGLRPDLVQQGSMVSGNQPKPR